MKLHPCLLFLFCTLFLSHRASAQVDCEDTTQVCIANAFTPNGDGLNDFWVIRNIGNYPGTLVEIFTTAGKLVFSNVDYNSTWTGKSTDGEDLPAGPYYYVVKLAGGNEGTYMGVVVIIRSKG